MNIANWINKFRALHSAPPSGFPKKFVVYEDETKDQSTSDKFFFTKYNQTYQKKEFSWNTLDYKEYLPYYVP